MELPEIKLEKVGVNKYRIEKIPGMKVEAVIYLKPQMLEQIKQDLSLLQLAEAAMLPGVISPVVGMPDIHEGFGLPIGGVMATTGLISVGAVGMDINCGVRLISTNLSYNEKTFSPETLRTLIHKIEREIPIGLGGERRALPPRITLKDVVLGGAEFVVNQGYGKPEDLQSIEEGGRLKEARYEALTPRALKRADREVGTLGSGNHFIEFQKIEEISDPEIAKTWGLSPNQICFMVHCGSRALGHQTCVDYTEIFWNARDKYKMEIPRKGLAALPIETPEGQNYFCAMAASVNFAFANRQLIMFELENLLTGFFPGIKFSLVYDVAHNIAKWETAGSAKKEVGSGKLLIHRKGATRALPAGHPKNPQKYLATGHPAIVPGSMGTPSYVLVGTPKASETFFSVNHGAGRLMSRKEAFRTISKDQFETSMGSIIYNLPFHKIADEAPGAYKNIEDVVETLVEAGITRKIVKLVPLAVVKGD
ncbi:MAG: RtcB family protein [Patescibacteria group bacterium]